MGILLVLILVAGALIYGWIKLINAIFNPWIRKANKSDNPYIQMHRAKFQNDEKYDEYLIWLDKQGGDMPFEKWKTQEELKVERTINKKLKL